MRIAILGTRGIPNNYGGFEQFAERLSTGLAEKGHEVFVYCPGDHPVKEQQWKKVNRIRVRNPERWMGSTGMFIYDLCCIMDSRKRQFDIIYQLGYTSSSVWGWLLPSKSTVITNMDGFEWKRSKYNYLVQQFLRYAEWLAVRSSDRLVADSRGMQTYLQAKYGKEASYHPYGTDVFISVDDKVLEKYKVEPYNYNLLIARLVPENSIALILQGVVSSGSPHPFLVVGNFRTSYGKELKNKFGHDKRIRFLDPEYNPVVLNNLRRHCRMYFHGHTVGGTNPSLLEAMGAGTLIAGHRNEFNSSVLGNEAFYFESSRDVHDLLDREIENDQRTRFINVNSKKVAELYHWPKIIEDYERYFMQVTNTGKM